MSNLGCDFDDFELSGYPYCQAAASAMRGTFDVSLWTGDNGTGINLLRAYWKDVWDGAISRKTPII